MSRLMQRESNGKWNLHKIYKLRHQPKSIGLDVKKKKNGAFDMSPLKQLLTCFFSQNCQ